MIYRFLFLVILCLTLIAKVGIRSFRKDEVQNDMRGRAETIAVPCRDDFAEYAQDYFVSTKNAAEVGVFEGEFSAKNLEKWKHNYFMIDAWQFRPEDAALGGLVAIDKNFQDDAKNQLTYDRAKNAAIAYSNRTTMIRDLSVNASKRFSDGFFDWVYLDAMHDRDNVLRDLHAWWPKLRSGGLFSGDDFAENKDTEYMTQGRHEKAFGWIPRGFAWGVVSAVQEFAEEMGNLTVHVTYVHDCYEYPAWYIIKP